MTESDNPASTLIDLIGGYNAMPDYNNFADAELLDEILTTFDHIELEKFLNHK